MIAVAHALHICFWKSNSITANNPTESKYLLRSKTSLPRNFREQARVSFFCYPWLTYVWRFARGRLRRALRAEFHSGKELEPKR